MREVDEKSNEEKDCGDNEVRQFDHVGFRSDVGLKLACAHSRFLCGCVLDSRQNKSGAESGDERTADGIERLREIETALGGFRRTENGNVRIGADFEERLAGRHAEKSELDERGLEIGEVEKFFEMWDQDVVEVDSDRPQKKQAGDQNERQQISSFGDWRGCLSHWLP